MPFFSPVVLFDAPYSLAAGETLCLRYRMVVSATPVTVNAAEEFFRDWATSVTK